MPAANDRTSPRARRHAPGAGKVGIGSVWGTAVSERHGGLGIPGGIGTIQEHTLGASKKAGGENSLIAVYGDPLLFCSLAGTDAAPSCARNEGLPAQEKVGQTHRCTKGDAALANTGLAEAVSRFGRAAKAKLANRAISGAPEDQLRSPLETLIEDLAALAGHAPGSVTPVGGKAFPHRQVSLAAECGQILSGPQARRVLPI